MTLTAENVRVGVTGGVFGAPSGTTLPTGATGSLDAGFDELGYVSEEGVVQSEGIDVTEIKAWQNAAVVRKIQTKHDLTYKLTLLETSAITLYTFYSNYSAGVSEIRGEAGLRQSWVIEVLDGDNTIRIVIPDGQITEKGDVSYVNGDAVKYPITITAFPDESDVKAYVYLDPVSAS